MSADLQRRPEGVSDIAERLEATTGVSTQILRSQRATEAKRVPEQVGSNCFNSKRNTRHETFRLAPTAKVFTDRCKTPSC